MRSPPLLLQDRDDDGGHGDEDEERLD